MLFHLFASLELTPGADALTLLVGLVENLFVFGKFFGGRLDDLKERHVELAVAEVRVVLFIEVDLALPAGHRQIDFGNNAAVEQSAVEHTGAVVDFEHEAEAVEVHAEKNEEALRLMIAMDEGACKLGECALVPYDSPINRSGILFYNTLFDENASCHLALGMGYSSCLKDFEKYTPEEARELGVNDSMIHEDFMIGAQDLSITAKTRDGKEVAIFKDGGWAF